jgi:RND family efflux transporter MFP subunit
MRHFCTRVAAFGAFCLAVAGLLGCQRGKTPPPAPPPPHVTVARPVSFPVQHYLEYNGFLDAKETVQIKARVKGFLDLIDFKEGDEVEPGKVLYKIDPREFKAAVARSNADIAKAQADVANSKAQIRLAEADLERVKQAYERKVAAKTDLDKAVAQVAAANAQLETAMANVDAGEASLKTAELDLEYTTIKAPIHGRISRTLVTRGNLVGQNELTLLTTIVSMDPLYVYFDVPERDFVEGQKRYRESKQASQPPRVEVGVATEEGYPHVGQLNFQENRVETGTGTIRLRGIIPNPHHKDKERLLYPGLYARVRIPIGTPEALPVIPEDALMTGQEGRFVYVLMDGNIVDKRSVTVGPKLSVQGWTLANPKPSEPGKGGDAPASIPIQSMVAIEKGLAAGERIIVNGLQRAKPGAPVVPDEWDLRKPGAVKK